MKTKSSWSSVRFAFLFCLSLLSSTTCHTWKAHWRCAFFFFFFLCFFSLFLSPYIVVTVMVIVEQVIQFGYIGGVIVVFTEWITVPAQTVNAAVGAAITTATSGPATSNPCST
jgi:hypothetical protein